MLNVKGQPHSSPCRGICSATSQGDKICIGCGRTDIEVRDWNTYTVEHKIKINKRLKDAKNSSILRNTR